MKLHYDVQMIYTYNIFVLYLNQSDRHIAIGITMIAYNL